jgi:hypothetical protein
MEGFAPDEIANQRSAPNEENWFLLPDRFSRERALRKDDPAVWPDVSPTPSFVDQSRRGGNRFEKRNVLKARLTCRHQAAGNFLSESYFFFLATLRVFFAVFFTALFAFFAFLAFLAMLPSDVSEMAYSLRALGNRNALPPEYTNTLKKTVSA